MVQVEAFSSKVSLLNCNKETARIYGKVKAQLKKNGTPIPENDIWIAAVAIQHDLVLVTNDNHFLNVEGLTIEMLRY
jgi:tRNA(fMet)-specific endonuclease VapC